MTGTLDYPTPGMALAAAPPPKRLNWLRILALIGVIGFIAACGIAVLGVIGYSGGVTALLVGTGAAILPVPLLVLCFLWLDRYEPEPTRYLAFCFAWGACVATATALFVNTEAGNLFKAIGLPDQLVAVLVAPFIEETMKALGPLLLFWVRRKTFSGMIDAIVYCGLSATGFAMVENILYLGVKGYATGAEQSGALGGARAVVAIFIARIVLTGFAHPLFTSMTGIGLGVAARASSRGVRAFAPFAGLLVAMMLHGSWNLMSVVASQSMYVVLYGYFAVMVPIFLGMVTFTLWLRSSEGRMAERVLPEYARAGWLSPPEVAALGTLGRRKSARQWAKRVAGDAGAKAMKAFQFDATRLALLRDRMRRGIGTASGTQLAETLEEERTLLTALMAYRRVFVGRDPQSPRALWDGARYHVTFPDGMVRTINAPSSPVAPVPIVLPPSSGYPYR
jgi:RsiW-degrading membrane proteinase PrsW (M82 family)